MRFSTVATAALAAVPAVAAARGSMGFALGTKEKDVRLRLREGE
jgi:hypothetical protein